MTDWDECIGCDATVPDGWSFCSPECEDRWRREHNARPIADECRQRCAYGTCRDPGRYGGPYGCGGCCGCLGGCQVAYESTLPLAEPQ